MSIKKNINEYIDSLVSSKRLGHQVVFQKIFKARPASLSPLRSLISGPIREMLKASGINSLYTHQEDAIGAICNGKNVVVSTPTASGKTLIYNIPVFEKILKRPEAKAIYLFPLKALARDQLKTFENMAALIPGANPTAAVYDGDTSAWHRKKIRNSLPNIILTNPEMLHLSLLPYHEKWEDLFANLEMVVVDEVHTYRGVLGSHMAQIFRRFHRICDHYGSHPKFVFSSATIANPDELVSLLTGKSVVCKSKSGAPQGKRHFVFINPTDSPSHTAILLLKAALHRGLRTIVYTQSRKLAELISVWAGSQSGKYANKISAYRAGFLAEERREIEKKLLSGELLAVITTSALELGIDIGDLDLCLLVGYPGTVMSTWQRGGRVGRSGLDSAIIMIAGEDSLDQYFMRHPDEFFNKSAESAVINPFNPDILKKHLVCAAAELPLKFDDDYLNNPLVQKSVDLLEMSGELLRSEDGSVFYSSKRSPHRHINLRGTGARFNIVTENNGDNLGEVDGFRAFRETHPGAIYLHKGKTYSVENLDIGAQTVIVARSRPNYYTRVRASKQTEILDIYEEKKVLNTCIRFGRLKITDQVTGYEKWQIHGKKRINIIDLKLPPQIFETDGIWITISESIQSRVEAERLHFMGGIHAVEHAIIGICPLLVLTDRNDFGGISIPFHSQVKSAAVFVYDGYPGGIGLSRQAFVSAEKLLIQTKKMIDSCPCDTGCPSCVHSPKCGSGNRPIDKSAAAFILERLIDPKSTVNNKQVKIHKKNKNVVTDTMMGTKTDKKIISYCVFDIETQRSAQEVGGWNHANAMGISCVVLYDSRINKYVEFLEKDVSTLVEQLSQFDLVIGFNIKRFDYQVLRGYSDFDFAKLPTLDLLEVIHRHLGYRISLNHLAQVNLGATKSADGLQALRWWKQGKIKEIVEYCKKDVKITKDIFVLGQKNGFLLFKNKAGKNVRIPISW